MASREHLGDFEQIVLLAMMRLGDDAYGMMIRREIAQRTGREVTLGSIYPTLHRLERKGFVRSYDGAPRPTRGGRSRRLFEILPQGLEALYRSRRVLAALWEGFEPETTP